MAGQHGGPFHLLDCSLAQLSSLSPSSDSPGPSSLSACCFALLYSVFPHFPLLSISRHWVVQLLLSNPRLSLSACGSYSRGRTVVPTQHREADEAIEGSREEPMGKTLHCRPGMRWYGPAVVGDVRQKAHRSEH